MQDAPDDMFVRLCEIPKKDGLKIDPNRFAGATDVLWNRQNRDRYQRPSPPSSAKKTTPQTQRRRFPVLAALLGLTVACSLIAALAAAAFFWGPDVGLPWLNDLLSESSK